MKSYWTSLAIRKVHIKTTSFHLPPIRMAITKNIITSIVEDVEKLEYLYIAGGNVKCNHFRKQFGCSSKC